MYIPIDITSIVDGRVTVDDAVNGITSDQFLEWLDSCESAKWIRAVCNARTDARTGTEIAILALCEYIKYLCEHQDEEEIR